MMSLTTFAVVCIVLGLLLAILEAFYQGHASSNESERDIYMEWYEKELKRKR